MENSLKKIKKQKNIPEKKKMEQETIKCLMYPTIDTNLDEAKERIGLKLFPMERIKVSLTEESNSIKLDIIPRLKFFNFIKKKNFFLFSKEKENTLHNKSILYIITLAFIFNF